MYHFGPGWEAGRSLNLFLSCPQSLSLNREKERGEPSYTEAQVTFLFNFSFQIQPGAMNRGREDSPPLAEVTRGVKYSGRGEVGAVWKYVSVEPDVFYRLLVLDFLILLLN